MQGRTFEEAIPAQSSGNGLITIDLSGLDPMRFSGSIGADYVSGNEDLKYQRKVYSARTRGNAARFLIVIEPFESRSVVRRVHATSADELTIELTNGTAQTLCLLNFEGDGSDIKVVLTGTKNGNVAHREEADQ